MQTISQRLHEVLSKIIASTPPGERLPSEPELARQLGVSRATLREAMRSFETQGMLYRRQGSGTYVIHPSQVIESGLEILESIDSLAKRIGLSVSMGTHASIRRPASEEEAAALGLPSGTEIVCVSRVILAEGYPAAFLVDVLPEDIICPEDLETEFTGSVLDFLLQRGSPVLTSSRCDITAVNATHDVAYSLGIQRGDVLLRFVAYLYTTTGQVVDYSFSYFIPGYFRFHVVRKIGNGAF